jgi:riboflavin kinase/FMN adenylyltransferase
VRYENGSVVTIGAYDGVHIGHRRVIQAVRERAAEAGLDSVVVTFDKNPALVVNPDSAPLQLTDVDLKVELLRATGVDEVVVLAFDAGRAKERAEDFVTEVLVGMLAARVVVVGEDFHFGNRRKGDVRLLRAMGLEAGFTVEPVLLVSDSSADEVVSSTRIRALITQGRLDEASALLGRPHEVTGSLLGLLDPGPDGLQRLSVEVPKEILLPLAGTYSGSVSTRGLKPQPAQVVVCGRASRVPQHLVVQVAGGIEVKHASRADDFETLRVAFGQVS